MRVEPRPVERLLVRSEMRPMRVVAEEVVAQKLAGERGRSDRSRDFVDGGVVDRPGAEEDEEDGDG